MDSHAKLPLLTSKDGTKTDVEDIPPINGIKDFFVQFGVESKKLWYLAGPAILTTVCQYSLGAITQTFAGHIGTLELAAFSIEHLVISSFSLGIMLGMCSALETVCGQAFGAGQVDMLGIYLQRSWIILFVTGFIMMFVYIFVTPLLLLIGQTEAISHSTGKVALWMIPQIFAYAFHYPITKFLQAQSKIMVMAYISVVAVVIHTLFSWLFMLKLGWGLGGGALVLNFSWWFIVIAEIIYILSGTCGRAWSGLSWVTFSNFWGFVKLSIASAVMLCLELWYFSVLMLIAGYLKNAEIAVDALSICINILGWAGMIALGLNAAISVRLSNELGVGHPRTAKFAILVVVISSSVIAVLFVALISIFRKQYPSIFADSLEVQHAVYFLTPLLAICIIFTNIQRTLTGVSVGAGWQSVIAYINIACYYILGVPLGLCLGFAANWGYMDRGVDWNNGTSIDFEPIGIIRAQIRHSELLSSLSLELRAQIFDLCFSEDDAFMTGKRIKEWSGEVEVEGER
ncbi:hypothetical protein LXL04_031415 [Taraxacum kok-saghyz]